MQWYIKPKRRSKRRLERILGAVCIESLRNAFLAFISNFCYSMAEAVGPLTEVPFMGRPEGDAAFFVSKGGGLSLASVSALAFGFACPCVGAPVAAAGCSGGPLRSRLSVSCCTAKKSTRRLAGTVVLFGLFLRIENVSVKRFAYRLRQQIAPNCHIVELGTAVCI